MSSHLEELRRQYPGQMILKPEQIAKVLGSARQTVYNQHSNGIFPIRPIYVGKTWGCSIVDTARFLDTGEPQLQVVAPVQKLGRKPSVRQKVMFQMFWDRNLGESVTTSPNLNRNPSQKQVLKYREFWDDVIVRMKRIEDKTIIIRMTPPREIK